MASVGVPAGLREKLGMGLLHSGIKRLYDEWKRGEGSFRNDVTRQIREHKCYDPINRDEVTLYDLAKRYGAEADFERYLQDEFKTGRTRLAKVLDFVTNVKDGLEDAIEGAEAAATVVGVATGGLGSITVQAGSNAIEVPVYAAVQTIYTGLAGLLGFTSGIYKGKKGIKHYAIDTIKGALGATKNVIPLLGTLEPFMNLDDKRPRIATALACNIHQKLLKRIREKTGKEINLEDTILHELRSPKKTLREEMKDTLQEYLPIRGYTTDFSPETAYARV